MSWLEPVTLRGDYVAVEPLDQRHHDDLVTAVCDGNVFELWYTAIPLPAEMADEIARRRALFERGSMLPFAVIDRASGAAVGMTTFMNVDADSRRVEIGSTWYRKSAWRTALNTECKLLLLEHAFETLDCVAVEFRTASLNRASRRAIERLGAHLDGVLRSQTRYKNGALRDTCVYSIIACEWPAVRAGLTFALARHRNE